MLYSNPFVGGAGSYQGALLIGEALQSPDAAILKNSGEATELAWVQSLITGSLPGLPGTGLDTTGVQGGSGAGLYSLGLGNNWDYAYFMAKWGSGQESSDHALWLVKPDDILKFEIPHGLSHSKIWVHTPEVSQTAKVPEAVSTLSLLAGSFALLAKLRQRRS